MGTAEPKYPGNRLRGVPRKNRKGTTGALRDHCLEEDMLAGGQALTNFSLAQALLTQEI